jgi:hypothetical protein
MTSKTLTQVREEIATLIKSFGSTSSSLTNAGIPEINQAIRELNELEIQIGRAQQTMIDEIRYRHRQGADKNKLLVAEANKRLYEVSQAIPRERRIVELAEARRDEQEKELRASNIPPDKIELIVTTKAEIEAMKIHRDKVISELESELRSLERFLCDSPRYNPELLRGTAVEHMLPRAA